MPEPANLVRAELRELDAEFDHTINESNWTKVQFNPETLKVTFANQIVQGSGPGDQRGSPARQFVGAGTTKLALALWFDVTAYPTGTAPTKDVRELTKKVAYFITPTKLPAQAGGGKPAKGGKGGAAPAGGGGDAEKQPQYAPPAVRFVWGTFQFDGIMESLEETLEFWSPDGRPLRAGVSIGLTAQKITFGFNADKSQGASSGPALGATPGTRPLAQAPAGATLPGMAASARAGGSWQSIATANGIEDPLRMAPGQLVDLSLTARPGGGR